MEELVVLIGLVVPAGFVVFPWAERLKGFAATEEIVVLVGLVIPTGFVVFPLVVVLKGFLATEEFVVLTGLVGTGAFQLACTLPFARFAHVLPQYG